MTYNSNGSQGRFYQPREFNAGDEPIFADHAMYRRTYQPNEPAQYIPDSDARMQQHLGYPYYPTAGNQQTSMHETSRYEMPRYEIPRYDASLPRSVSAYDYGRRGNPGNIANTGHAYGHPNQHPQHHHLPHSISIDSWESEHIYLQNKTLAKLYSKIDSSRKELVDIEHYTLAKEEEYRTLQKVAKNPTEEDLAILGSEVLEMQRALQSLYDECENLNVDFLESPSSNVPQSLHIPETSRHLQGPNQQYYQPSWKPSYDSQSRQDPIDSPSRLLLLNPHDDSLATPMFY